MLVNGLNKVRGFWDTIIDAIEIGTGTTQETGQDTDLETPIAGTESVIVTSTTSDQYLVKEGTLSGTNAGGESATEIIWKTQSPEKAVSRITFAAQTYNTSSDIIVSTRWHWRGRREA